MSYPPPPRVPPGPRRRSLLVSVAGGVLLTGCSDGDKSGEEGTAGTPSVAERVRARAARDSRGIVERYDAVLAAFPTLAERVGPLRAEAVRHAQAFGETAPKPSPSPSVSPSGTPGGASPSPSAASPSAAGPATEKDALAQLAAAERELADRRAKALLDVPGELARLLASVAAAGAAHAYLLTEGSR